MRRIHISTLFKLLNAFPTYSEANAIINANITTGNAVPIPYVTGRRNKDCAFIDNGNKPPKNSPAETGQNESANIKPRGIAHRVVPFFAFCCNLPV